MGAGIVGVLSVGFFTSSEFTEGDAVGVFYGGSGKQLLWQLADVITYFTWSFVTVGAIFMALRMAGMLRVSEEVELIGMDIEEHGGPAYIRSSVFESTYSAMLIPKSRRNQIMVNATNPMRQSWMEMKAKFTGNRRRGLQRRLCPGD
jgi:hypothetical protein